MNKEILEPVLKGLLEGERKKSDQKMNVQNNFDSSFSRNTVLMYRLY